MLRLIEHCSHVTEHHREGVPVSIFRVRVLSVLPCAAVSVLTGCHSGRISPAHCVWAAVRADVPVRTRKVWQDDGVHLALACLFRFKPVQSSQWLPRARAGESRNPDEVVPSAGHLGKDAALPSAGCLKDDDGLRSSASIVLIVEDPEGARWCDVEGQGVRNGADEATVRSVVVEGHVMEPGV